MATPSAKPVYNVGGLAGMMYPVTGDERSSQEPDNHTVATWWDAASIRPEAVIRRKLLQRIVDRGDLIFDVGANRGNMTLQFRRMGAHVVAVEPLADVAPWTVKEFFFMFRYDPMVTLVPVAVSDSVGIQRIHVHNAWPYLSTIDGDWMAHGTYKEFYTNESCTVRIVHTITVDDLVTAYGMPDFVNIDVEGHEDSVVRGISRILPALSLEYHEDWIPNESLVHLQDIAEQSGTYYVANYTFSEFDYNMAHWVTVPKMHEHLVAHVEKSGPRGWGDIYLVEVSHARDIGLDAHED